MDFVVPTVPVGLYRRVDLRGDDQEAFSVHRLSPHYFASAGIQIIHVESATAANNATTRERCHAAICGYQLYDAGRFILQLVGKVRSSAGTMKSVFQPRPVFSTSYFASLVKV